MNFGEKTNKKFLTGIIPDNFKEVVFKAKSSWTICVDGDLMELSEWKELENKIKEEFGQNLIEISKYVSRFIVYLRRDAS